MKRIRRWYQKQNEIYPRAFEVISIVLLKDRGVFSKEYFRRIELNAIRL
jgi:hypothetical protein